MYRRYPHIGKVLPAVGYSPEQLRDLERTIARTDAEVVVSGTPCDLGALVRITPPVVRASYELAEAGGEPSLGAVVSAFLAERGLG